MNTPVTLQQILDARDARADRQRALLLRYPGCALISLTVNMPGPLKDTPDTRRVFRAGCAALDRALEEARVRVLHAEQAAPATGGECRRVVALPALAAKRLCCALEEALPYGRLLDADVLDATARPVPRTALGLPERGCMVCGRAGAYCASRRLHPLETLLDTFCKLAAYAPPDGTEGEAADG